MPRLITLFIPLCFLMQAVAPVVAAVPVSKPLTMRFERLNLADGLSQTATVMSLWQEWWFWVTAGLLLIGLLAAGYALRVRNIQAQKRALEVQVTQRTDELQRANEQLAQEVAQRARAEEALAKRAAEELQQSEARFRAMFDNAAVGMALMGLDRRILQINQSAERITGYPVAELLNINPSELAHPADRNLDRELFRELVAGGRDQYQVEKRYLHKDGRLFWGRVTYSSVRGRDGQPEYLIGMIEDIDEQKAARQKLEAQERNYRQRLEERVHERTLELSQTNMRLQQEIEQRQRAEAALAHKAAEEAVTAERTRLARDLHDAVTQTLFSASLVAEVLPDLWQQDEAEARRSINELRQLTRGALAEMRTLLLELRPAALTQARFEDLLKQLAEALVGRSRLPIAVCVDGERRLPPEVQVALYRIAQESLNNVVKYARASRVDVHLSLAASGVHLEIGDDGIGFDVVTAKPTSLGLRIMRERAEAIGADLHIASAFGRGTKVSVTWHETDGGNV